MKTFAQALFGFSLLLLAGLALPQNAFAATSTVCAGGCDFTRLDDAFNSGLFPGDVVTVDAGYDLSTDNGYLALPPQVTLDCQNSGAVIGGVNFNSPIYMSVGSLSVVQNCNITNARIMADYGFGATIRQNTLTGNSEIGAFNTVDVQIRNNEGQMNISANTAENITIDQNSLAPDINSTLGQNFINLYNTTNTTITANELLTTAVNDPYYHDYISVFESDTVTIDGNLIDQRSIETANNSTGIRISGGSHVGILNNLIYLGGRLNIGQTMIGIQLSGGTLPTIADVRHNTIKMSAATCNDCAGFAYTNWSSSSPVTADVAYNLIAGSSSSTANQSGLISYGGSGAGLNINQSWMGFSGLRRVNNSNDVATGPNAVIMNGDAAFRDEDVSTTNDWELAPYSNFLDIDGTTDAGAIPGVRNSSFMINQAGPIDYSTIDATDTQRISQHVRTGDTLNFGVGTYSPVSLVQGDRLASNVIMNGSGPGTIIQYSGNQGSSLSFSGISNTIVNGITFSGSAVTTTYGYTLTKALYSFGGNDYNEAGNLGVSPTTALLIGPGCEINAADGPVDITNSLNINSTDWNIALVQAFGFRLVAYMPNAVASNGAQLNAQCGFTVDAFISSAFISQGNQLYSYDPTAVALAGVTLLAGESAPSITSDIQENALISNQLYSLGGIPYTDTTQFGAPTDGQMLLLVNPCSPVYITSPANLTRVNNPNNTNWNLFLISQNGWHATVLAPENLADSTADFSGCGAVTIDAFVQDAFVYSNGGYTYNAAAVALAGITLEPGVPNPPYLVPVDHTLAQAGIFLMNSHDNTFLNSIVTNNDNGFVMVQSEGNAIINSTLTGNANHDLVSLGEYENSTQDTSFDRASSVIAGAGGLTALFSARIHVEDGAANPLAGMNATLSSSNNATSAQMVTDIAGDTPYVIFPAFRLSSSDISATAGGYNPQLIHVDEIAPFFERNVTSTLNAPFQTFTVDASIAPPVVVPPQTGGGGGALIPVKPTAVNDGSLALVLDRVESLGNGMVNIWVRLNGNPYTVRGFSLSTDPELKNTALQNLQSMAALAVSNASGKVTVYGRYYSTTGEASELYSLTVDLAAGTGIPSVPTTPGLPLPDGNGSTQCTASPFTRDLETGMVAEDVRQLQIFLNAQGFAVAKAGELGSKGKETTRFGAGTRNALKAFQKANKLAETGILSNKTRTLVQGLTQKPTACKTTEKFPRDLKTGSIGTDVKALQQFLNAQNFSLAKAGQPGSKGFETSFFGAATREALKAFEKANKLPITGILSGVTRQKANQTKTTATATTPAIMNVSPFMKYIPWEVK